MHWMIKCMLAWLRNVNIAILVSHVSWNVLTSSTLLAQPCICTIVLNGHAPISNLHCQFLCCCALLQVKISLKTHPSHYLSLFLFRLPEATTLTIAGHLPLITTSYSARPSLIIQPIPFAVSGMRMCACMCELGHRAFTPEHAILKISFILHYEQKWRKHSVFNRFPLCQ